MHPDPISDTSTPPDAPQAPRAREGRRPNRREAIREAAEALFAARGFRAVTLRDIAAAADAHPASVTYHFGDTAGLLAEIYARHCGPMNARRRDLLREARRVTGGRERLAAVVRAYILPAFTSSSDLPGGGARFARLRAVVSAEGDPYTRRLRAESFDETTRLFVEALQEAAPHRSRSEIVWQAHFVVGSLYFTLSNPERLARISDGEIDGTDGEAAMDAIVATTVRSLAGTDDA